MSVTIVFLHGVPSCVFILFLCNLDFNQGEGTVFAVLLAGSGCRSDVVAIL